MIRRINTGRRVLTDWLGAGGKPVPIEQAEKRAAVCQYCIHNYKGSWLYSMATQMVINAQKMLRRNMGIKLSNDEHLHICDLCGCQLKLKVHVPFIHIYAHTSQEQLAKYPDFCWQKTELQNLKPK